MIVVCSFTLLGNLSEENPAKNAGLDLSMPVHEDGEKCFCSGVVGPCERISRPVWGWFSLIHWVFVMEWWCRGVRWEVGWE